MRVSPRLIQWENPREARSKFICRGQESQRNRAIYARLSTGDRTRRSSARIIVNATELERLLSRLTTGEIDIAAASQRILDALRAAPLEDLGFARIDTHRELRQGFPEVILGLGKTPTQIAAIAGRIVERGQPLLITRAGPDAFETVRQVAPAATYHEQARAITLVQGDICRGNGTIIVACAGTSALQVAGEAGGTGQRRGE